MTQNLQQQNMDVTAGQFGMAPAPDSQARQYTLVVAGRLADTGEFENVILKLGPGGAVTRLRDVGRVELGAQSYGQAFTLDGRPAAGLAVFQSPDANALAVATAVQASLAGAAAPLPGRGYRLGPVRFHRVRQRLDPTRSTRRWSRRPCSCCW